jgi:UDP:flavonoid glycosyltransferase YjiC (YdhE family)
VPADVRAWLDGSDRPYVYVSFGSFLSERADVLTTVMTALRSLNARVALATGSAHDLPQAPPDWLVRPHLPQTALLARASAVITHGGNNSVTEAMTFGVPLVVLPFSTDQFAGAAAVEAAGLGVALDPNIAPAEAIAGAVLAVGDGVVAARAGALGEELRRVPGPDVARAAIAG